jgi:peptide deformylase
MAILKIARMGHPILATPARPVADPRHPEIRRLVNDMVETMTDANGAGLAAPQVHVPLRVVVFQAPGEREPPGLSQEERFDHTAPLTVLINPEIEVLGPDLEGGWEGCLSVPGLRGWVERPDHIRYRGRGWKAKRLSGWRAASTPGWCSMNATIWRGGFTPREWATCRG